MSLADCISGLQSSLLTVLNPSECTFIGSTEQGIGESTGLPDFGNWTDGMFGTGLNRLISF